MSFLKPTLYQLKNLRKNYIVSNIDERSQFSSSPVNSSKSSMMVSNFDGSVVKSHIYKMKPVLL